MYNHQLDTFIKVADAGSFSKASEQLYISTNAVMKQINSLEGRIGTPLFHRTYKGLSLTPAGQSLYRDAKYIIQYSKDAVIRALEKAQDQQHILRIGTSFTTSVDYLFHLWSEISKIQPQLKFELVSFENNLENAREIMGHFGQKIDFVAGIYSENLLRERHCTAFYLYTTPLCVAVPIGHHLYSKDELQIEDLYNERIMLIEKNYMDDFDILREDIENKYPLIHIDSFPFFNIKVFNQAVNHNQIMIGVEQWHNIHPMMKMIPVNWKYTIPFGILHAPTPTQEVKIFLDIMKQIDIHKLQP